MATRALGYGRVPMRVRRGVEWSLFAIVVLVLMVLLGQRMRELQGQGELSAIKTTLGALRTAFVIQHLQQSAMGKNHADASLQQNPFELLSSRPVNYVGDIYTGQTVTVVPGSWLFDPVCICVGYLPIYGNWLDSPSGSSMIWLQVSPPPGPFQLTVKEIYTWQGQVLN